MNAPDIYKSRVHRILVEDRDARNSDKVLFIKVIKETFPELAKMPLEVAMMHEDLPSWDSITRARRRWQEFNEDCMSDIQIAMGRAFASLFR